MKNKTYLKKMPQLTRWFICLMILGGLGTKYVNAQVCDATYTITISTIPSGSYADEIGWEIRNAVGAAVAFGGPYPCYACSNSATYVASGFAPNHGPFTFWIEAQGSFNDNVANWSVSCPAGGTLISGVTVGGQALTNSGTFCCVPPSPTVSSFSPGSGCGGSQSVAITGNFFTGATAVTFGGTPAQSFIVNSATSITAVPAVAGTTGVIAVTTPAGTGSSAGSFTVNTSPVASIAPPTAAICSGGSPITLTASPSGGGQTYLWSTTATTQAISVSPVSNTTYTVTVTATGCTGTATRTVTVNPLPPPPTSSPASVTVCQNAVSSGSFTGSCSETVTQNSTFNTAIAPITWTSTLVATSRTQAVSGFPAGYLTSNVSVTLNIAHTWGGDIVIRLQAPNGGPLLDVMNNPADPNLDFGAGAGGTIPTLPYTWNSSGVALPGSGAVPSPGPYLPTMSFSGFNGFNPNGTWTVTVSDGVGGDGGTINAFSLNITAGIVVTSDAAWYTAPTGGSPIFTGATFNPITNGGASTAVPGTFNFYPGCISGAGCESTRPTRQFIVLQGPSETASNDGPKCLTEMVQLSLTSAGAQPPTSWAWTGPNSFTSNVQNPTNGPLTAADAGVYNVTYTAANTCTGTASTNVVVGAAPSAVVSGGGAACLGNSFNATLTFTGLPPWSYTLSAAGQPNVVGSTSNNPENVAVTPATSGTHNYTLTTFTDGQCGSGFTSGSATGVISTAPPVNTVSSVGGATDACSGSVALISTNTVTGQNINYSWNTGSNSSVVKFSTNIGGPFSPGPFLTNTNSVYAEFGSLAGGSSGYNICVQGTNGCGSTNNKCTWIRGVVSPPAAITGSAIVCDNALGQPYSAASVPSATTYTWSFPGATINGQGSQSVTIDFPAFTSGNLCVTAALTCGGSSTSAPKCMTISNATVNPGAMNGLNKICPGQTGTVYSIPPISGATTYTWTAPTGATITGGAGTNSITVDWPNPYTLSGSVCVTATSACGDLSAARCKTVISSIPATPGYIGGQPSGVCGQTIVYSIANVQQATSYTWAVPAGGTINSGQGTNSISVTWGIILNGQVSVTANSACGSSPARTLNITGAPSTPGPVTQLPGTICNGGPANFSITAVAGATGYIWAVPANGTTIDNGQGTTSMDATWGTGAGTVTVKSSNICGVSPSTSNKLVTPGCKLASGAVSATGTEMNLVAYPNPAHERVTVSFTAAVKESYVMSITDLAGRVIYSTGYQAAEGNNTTDIDLGQVAKGVYTLELLSTTGNQKARLIVE